MFQNKLTPLGSKGLHYYEKYSEYENNVSESETGRKLRRKGENSSSCNHDFHYIRPRNYKIIFFLCSVMSKQVVIL